jgi:hypothetical protein
MSVAIDINDNYTSTSISTKTSPFENIKNWIIFKLQRVYILLADEKQEFTMISNIKKSNLSNKRSNLFKINYDESLVLMEEGRIEESQEIQTYDFDLDFL